MKAQRLRLRFRLGPPASGLNHKEIASAIAAAFDAAGFPVSRSEGKRPTPLVMLAAPLPQDVTSDCELADIFLAERACLADATGRIAARLPEGMAAVCLADVGVAGPSLQSQVRWAEYVAEFPGEALSREDASEAVKRLLGSDSCPVEHVRESRVRRYDLRPLVLGMDVEGSPEGGVTIRMRLRAEQEMTARADQTVAAMGLPPPARIRRTRLEVEQVPAALAAYRRAREPEGY